ncbi:MAG: TonB C-terminal domain-containing protein [bacterium]|nr:TonB C-terminal domain-containing protein [bacterium]
MDAILETWEIQRQRQYRRFVGFSAGVHLVAALMFLLSPNWRPARQLPGVVRIDLVAVAPAAAVRRPAPPKPKPLPKPKAAPKPKPKAKPVPKAPIVDKKVLPKDPVAKPTPKPPAVAPAEEVMEYEDVMAQLRKDATEDFPEAAPQPAAPAARIGPVGGPGRLITAEEAAWRERVRAYVLRGWVLAPGFRSQALVTTVDVRLSAGGDVMNTHVVQRSGNPWYDESVERAIQKAAPLPAPPESGSWQFRFSPTDLR